MLVADLSYRERKRVGFVCHASVSDDNFCQDDVHTEYAASPVVTILLNMSLTVSLLASRPAGLLLMFR